MRRPPLTALALLLSLPVALGVPGQAAAKGGPPLKGGSPVGRAMPALTLPDVAGRRHSLPESGRPVTLLFFCGCTPCHDFARLWGQVQRDGDLATQAPAHRLPDHGPAARSPATVVVFLGGATDARLFAAQTGLDLSQTLLLFDPSDEAGQRFGVIQCPRVFVADGARRLVYTSPDDPAPRLSAPALVSRTLTAWRHLPAGKKAAPEKEAVP